MEEKIDNLINILDNNETIINIKRDLQNIKSNKDLLENIKKYKITYSKDLKDKILANHMLIQYYQDENELNYLILEINRKLKGIINESN